jgi:RNA recognition motif-containing protein
MNVRRKHAGITIFVGNLPQELTEEELGQEFMAFGKVIFVGITREMYNGSPRIYGFVEMQSKSEGEAAIAGLEGKTLKGRTLNVIESRHLSRDYKVTDVKVAR